MLLTPELKSGAEVPAACAAIDTTINNRISFFIASPYFEASSAQRSRRRSSACLFGRLVARTFGRHAPAGQQIAPAGPIPKAQSIPPHQANWPRGCVYL